MKSPKELLPLLTLEEKIALVAGYHGFSTNPVPRLDIPSIKMSDGPHGLRVQPEESDIRVMEYSPATCFPTASCLANTFNPSLIEKMGKAMAEEAKYYGIDIILGPGVNIKRNPLCGRNFEYFSEDPYLAAKMGEVEVNGIQNEGIGVSLKHFAFNNSENYRLMGNSIVDMRAIREIYLPHFEYIVKRAKPETLMAAYNKVNGTHCSENTWLLTDILRKEWGYKGLVMSDWGTTHDRVLGIKSGLDLEMPGDTKICRKWIFDAVNNGTLDIADLDKAVENVLTMVYNHKEKAKIEEVDWKAHHKLAKDIALEGAVLLKNEGLLPLRENEDYLVIGELFEKSRYQGAGSSLINPYYMTSCKDAFDNNKVSYKYLKGYDANKYEPDESLIQEAINASKDYDKVLAFAGLTDLFECEGIDRKNLKIPQNQLALINALVKANKKIIVILFGGSVMELPFYEDADSILNMLLSGQNSGEATYELLFGKVSPSGRLSETWPIRYEDVPFYDEYSNKPQDVYKESIYVGYRYYLGKAKDVRFPFGFGLSYTSFEYTNLKVTQNDSDVVVILDVTNKGKVSGKETVQVYVSLPNKNTHHPLRELKGFTKVDLNPGETKSVSITIEKDSLRYWDISQNRFAFEDGEYIIQVGKNSNDIALKQTIQIKGETFSRVAQPIYESLDFDKLSNEEYEKIWNINIPSVPSVKPITLDSRIIDLKETFFGRMLYKILHSFVNKEAKKAKKLPDGPDKENKLKSASFLEVGLDASSLTTLAMTSGGLFTYNLALGFKDIANGRLFRGIFRSLKKVKAPKLPIEEKK